jgi:hypothetical protein
VTFSFLGPQNPVLKSVFRVSNPQNTFFSSNFRLHEYLYVIFTVYIFVCFFASIIYFLAWQDYSSLSRSVLNILLRIRSIHGTQCFDDLKSNYKHDELNAQGKLRSKCRIATFRLKLHKIVLVLLSL